MDPTRSTRIGTALTLDPSDFPECIPLRVLRASELDCRNRNTAETIGTFATFGLPYCFECLKRFRKLIQ
jgi:hypothetical protein